MKLSYNTRCKIRAMKMAFQLRTAEDVIEKVVHFAHSILKAKTEDEILEICNQFKGGEYEKEGVSGELETDSGHQLGQIER